MEKFSVLCCDSYIMIQDITSDEKYHDPVQQLGSKFNYSILPLSEASGNRGFYLMARHLHVLWTFRTFAGTFRTFSFKWDSNK